MFVSLKVKCLKGGFDVNIKVVASLIFSTSFADSSCQVDGGQPSKYFMTEFVGTMNQASSDFKI
jgi:hypothetical protein